MTEMEKEAQVFGEWADERELPEDDVMTDADAEKYLYAYRKNIEQRDKEIEWHRQQIEEAKAHCESRNAWLSMMLEEYFKRVPSRETKTQYSYKLSQGTLVRTKAKHELVLVDEEAAMEALDGTEYIKVKKSLDWAGWKKNAKDTGEMIPGVELQEVPEKFVVRTKTEE